MTDNKEPIPKRVRRNSNASVAYLRAGSPDEFTQQQFTVLFMELLRDRHPGPVTLLLRSNRELLYKRLLTSAHVYNKADAALCVNRMRNSYDMKANPKTGPGRECCFCETKRRLNDVTLFKGERGELKPNGTFIMTKQYVSAMRALMIVTRVEDAVIQCMEEIRKGVYDKVLTSNLDCQLALTVKKRELCETYNLCYLIVWMLSGCKTFVIN
jgi:hypothetical protein